MYGCCQALPCNSEVSDNVTAEMSSPRDDADNVLPPPPLTKNTVQHRIGLADIMSDADINTLTVQQLKRLLVNNYVDYRGCCEKQELVERVHELWSDHRKLNPPGKFMKFIALALIVVIMLFLYAVLCYSCGNVVVG